MPIADSLIEQIVQAIAGAIWRRPELTALRDPIETALEGNAFKQLTREAFEKLPADALPFFDEGYISMPLVQQELATYVATGSANVDELVRLYEKRTSTSAPAQLDEKLQNYLEQLRMTLVSDERYRGIILAHGQDAMLDAIAVLQRELHDQLGVLRAESETAHSKLLSQNRELLERLEAVLAVPEIKRVVEQRQGVHVFLSYSRKDAKLVKRVREALENAGHTVWQDTTAIKGGREWIKSIAEGIRRAYAIVTVVSEAAQDSEWVQIEFLEARRRGKEVIPIKVDASEIPMEMLILNVIHAYPDLDEGIARLLATLGKPQTNQAKVQLQAEQAAGLSQREQELEYLRQLQLERDVSQVYTPMAGQAILQAESEGDEIQRAPANIDPLFEVFDEMVDETFAKQARYKSKPVEDITQAVTEARQLVILGDPGSGKTTTLWKLAGDYIQSALVDEQAPLPIILNLGGLAVSMSIEEAIRARLAPLSFETLRDKRRLILLLDALNELPAGNRSVKVTSIRALIQAAQQGGSIAVVTCRELDYKGELDLAIQQKVHITPLDHERILQFCEKHLPTHGVALFWDLAGGEAVRETWLAWQEAGASFRLFWTAEDIPREHPNVYSHTTGQHDNIWHQHVKNTRSMMRLARNPYMLFMITGVYARTQGELPKNRGRLFDLFVKYLLHKREGLQDEADPLKVGLSQLAYHMQVEQLGTVTTEQLAREYLSEDQLYYAKSANLLDGGGELRFTHQLLQEYFAAKRLDREMQAGTPATQFFPPDKWWEPTGWEETAILLAGLYSDDCSPVVNWLRDAQPELAARCILESGAGIDDTTYAGLGEDWLPRAFSPLPAQHWGEGSGVRADAEPQARAAVGRALGVLDYDTLSNRHQRPILDNRKGVGVIVREEVTLPDIDWVEIPGGEFIFGTEDENNGPVTMNLPTFSISRYPITYAQFQTFLDDPAGIADPRWFEGLAADEKYKRMRDQAFQFANHPREMVNWYQAMAFCRWLSWRLGGIYELDRVMEWAVRLPTEQEWEKAARGTDGRVYPWGDDWDATKCNNYVEMGIGQTSAVGIFPDGASPYEILDMSGNVLEWCLTDYDLGEAGDLSNTNSRVLRGGSWGNGYPEDFRAACRDWYFPYHWYDLRGFRVSRSY